ncbi:hypothetical protein BKA70DRAFT_1368569 [Coprinopsis sp. MPI-PUGE-AT-0042]|nr:hypothetical protein BKA70DRAFT_1368569 [Coprinopsis sp. MPI-PUGE-AT-0042]
MVFSFFSRKPSVTVIPTTATTTTTPDAIQPEVNPDESDAQVTGMTSSSTPFVFLKEEQPQPQIPASTSSTPPVVLTGSPPPMPPPPTPSPAPEPQVTDPRALHNLINAVPPQTLHEYCLSLLDPAAFDAVTGRANQTRKRRRKSGVVTAEETAEALKPTASPLKPHPVLTPPTLLALTSFFRELVPPPQLHCVRCHKQYFELENSDYSCRVAHEDDSTIVERVGTKIIDSSDEEEDEDTDKKGKGKAKDGKRSQSPRRPRKSGVPAIKSSVYETLWGCCGQIVEGDGDQGPPDGWCYEGRHTTDLKRARFRADSTPQDDKLKSCTRMKCSRPPVSQASESTATPSVRSGAPRKRKRNTRASIDYREAPDEDEDEEAAERKRDEDFIVDDDAKSAGSASKRRPKDPSATRGRGRGRSGAGASGGGRKKVFKSKEEIDEKDDDDDSMQVDEPQAGPSNITVSPRSPPASPAPKPDSANPPSTAAKPKRPRGRPPGSTTKPVKPSPLGVQREDTIPTDEAGPSTSTPRGRSQVFVELPGRQGSSSPTRGGNVLTRADIISLKAKGSVASLRDKFENSPGGQGEEKRALRTRKKPLELGEVVGSSVDNEVEMM